MRLHRSILIALVSTAGSAFCVVLTGCENSAAGFRSSLSTGSGTTRSLGQTELTSLTSVAIDLSKEFSVPTRNSGTPINALQPSDSEAGYFLVETYPRDETVKISDIKAMLAELQTLSGSVSTVRQEIRKEQESQVEKEKAAEVERNKIELERMRKIEKLTREARPDTANVSSIAIESLQTTIDVPQPDDSRMKTLEAELLDLRNELMVKEAKVESALSKGNLIVVDWNQLGAGNIAGSFGPVGLSAKGESKATGIAILNGFRKIRRVSPNSSYDPAGTGTEPIGDFFTRPNSAVYALQAQEVLYFALDSKSAEASAKFDPKTASVGGWDFAAEAGVSRLQRLANFGSLRTPKIERVDTISTEFSSGWITVQLVGSPRNVIPRQQVPTGVR